MPQFVARGRSLRLDPRQQNVLMRFSQTRDAIGRRNGRYDDLIAVQNAIEVELVAVDPQAGSILVAAVEFIQRYEAADVVGFAVFAVMAHDFLGGPCQVAVPVAQVATLPVEPGENAAVPLVEQKIAAPIVAVHHAYPIHARQITVQPIRGHLQQRVILAAVLLPDAPRTVELPLGALRGSGAG